MMKRVFAALVCLLVVCSLNRARASQPGEPLPIEKGGKYGYVDHSGKSVIRCQYASAGNFSEGLAAVEVGEKWGYIDKTGQMVIQPLFKNALEFSSGIAEVEVGEMWTYIDKSGKLLWVPSK